MARWGAEPSGAEAAALLAGAPRHLWVPDHLGAFFLIPLYVMVVTSLKAMPEIRLGHLFSLPQELTFQPWIDAWLHACTGRDCFGLSPGFLNSVKITVPSVIISIVIASINGYALSFWRYKGANIFFGLLVFGAFVPYQVVIYPLIIAARELGPVLDAGRHHHRPHHLRHADPDAAVPQLLRLACRSNCSRRRASTAPASGRSSSASWCRCRCRSPRSRVILQVTGIWNDFLFGIVFAGRPNWPMTVQLNNIVNTTTGVREYNVNMAATILTAAVPLAIYFISGRWFVRGIAAGAVKG